MHEHRAIKQIPTINCQNLRPKKLSADELVEFVSFIY